MTTTVDGNSGGTAVTTTSTDTLTNKTLSAPTITGVMTGIGSDSATTFLVGNVALNNTGSWFNGPNTGSIGASGQKWLIIGHGQLTSTSAVTSLGIRIYNGSASIAESFTRNETTSGYVDCSCFAVVTLSAATTFTLQARDYGTTSGVLLSDNSNTTSITAVRLS